MAHADKIMCRMSHNFNHAQMHMEAPSVCRTLVIARHEEIRNTLYTALDSPGFKAHLYGDFIHAIPDFATFRPDIVVIEDELPRIDGWQASIIIRNKLKIPTFIIGHCHPDDGWPSAVKAGAEHYLKYPFTGEELRARLRAILRRYRSWTGQGTQPYLTPAATRARI